MARPLGFKKSQRLTRSADIYQVARKGKTCIEGAVKLHYLTKEESPSRLGIWVSKRDFKLAIDRNRIKRQVRSVFRAHFPGFLFPLDMVVRVSRPKDKLCVEKELQCIFTKIEVLKK